MCYRYSMTDFKLYYSLNVENVFIYIIIVLSLGNFLPINFFRQKKDNTNLTQYAVNKVTTMIL